MAQQGFDISKYITAADIVSAVTAGTIAYLTYKTKQDEPKPEQPHGQQATPQGQQPQGQASVQQSQDSPSLTRKANISDKDVENYEKGLQELAQSMNLTSDQRRLFASIGNTTFTTPTCIQDGNGVLVVVGQLKDGTKWMSPLEAVNGMTPRLSDTVTTQTGQVLDMSDVLNSLRRHALQASVQTHYYTGRGYFIDALGRLAAK